MKRRKVNVKGGKGENKCSRQKRWEKVTRLERRHASCSKAVHARGPTRELMQLESTTGEGARGRSEGLGVGRGVK